MSKADDMFKELGYEILFEDDKQIQYEFEGIYMDNEIKIDKKGKTILKEYSSGDSQEITMQELKAINKKIKELGWEEIKMDLDKEELKATRELYQRNNKGNRYNFEYDVDGQKILLKNVTMEEINKFLEDMKTEKDSSMHLKKVEGEER